MLCAIWTQGPFLSMDVLDRNKYKRAIWYGQNIAHILVTEFGWYIFFISNLFVSLKVCLLETTYNRIIFLFLIIVPISFSYLECFCYIKLIDKEEFISTVLLFIFYMSYVFNVFLITAFFWFTWIFSGVLF